MATETRRCETGLEPDTDRLIDETATALQRLGSWSTQEPNLVRCYERREFRMRYAKGPRARARRQFGSDVGSTAST